MERQVFQRLQLIPRLLIKLTVRPDILDHVGPGEASELGGKPNAFRWPTLRIFLVFLRLEPLIHVDKRLLDDSSGEETAEFVEGNEVLFLEAQFANFVFDRDLCFLDVRRDLLLDEPG